MVERVRCEHCGAECKRPAAKVIDGRLLNFCCSGCLQVYELLHEEAPPTAASMLTAQERPQTARTPAMPPAADAVQSTKTVLLPIVGMSCANCAAQIERHLRAVPGVMRVSVNLQKEQATVRFDARQTRVDGMTAAIRRAGYDVGLSGAAETTDGTA